MIPTLLLAGFVFGKWWRVTIPAAIVGWAVLLLVDGTVSDLSNVLGAAWFGLINVAVGVLAFQTVRLAFHGVKNNIVGLPCLPSLPESLWL